MILLLLNAFVICHLIVLFFSLKMSEVNSLQQELSLVFEKILIVEENLKKVDQNNENQIFQINEEVIDVLDLVNAYLIRFNKFIDTINVDKQ